MSREPGPPALAGGSFDRAAEHRTDEAWLAGAWQRGRVLAVDDERRVALDGEELLLVDAQEVPADAPRFFLGLREGVPHWAVVAELPRRLGARPAGLRDVGALVGDVDAALVTTAIALANWHATHQRCPRCGGPTEPVQAGWVRRCRADGSDHFPRTDPAVIMLVHDGGERCLLGRQPRWPARRYSTLAGFVEPGESLEQAVAREVAEEVGVTVRDVRYVASQPWPFPASLMLGFTALADPGELHLHDGEIEDARWLTRDEIRGGEVLLPPPVSIAARLISGWLDAG